MLRVDALRGDRIAIRMIKTDVDVAMRLPQIAVEALKAFKPTTPTHFFWSGNSTVAKQTDLYRNRSLKPIYFTFAYSAFAAMRIGVSGSASFHNVKKS
jgi:hypothetical protein